MSKLQGSAQTFQTSLKTADSKWPYSQKVSHSYLEPLKISNR